MGPGMKSHLLVLVVACLTAGCASSARERLKTLGSPPDGAALRDAVLGETKVTRIDVIPSTRSRLAGAEQVVIATVYDRDGNVLWERSFYTKFYPKGNVWEVSPDMAGKSPAEPGRALPPLVSDPPAGPPDVSWSGAGVAEDGVPSFGADTTGDGQSAATDDGSGSAMLAAGNGGAPAA